MPTTRTRTGTTPGMEPKNADAIKEAQAAVAALKAMCPDLSIFASVIAGREPVGPEALIVKPGASTCTDGKIVYLRPDARMAGRPTDDEWSQIKAGLFHEVAHIVFDSFRAISDADRAAALRHLTDEVPESYRRDALLRHIADESRKSGANYKSMSSAFHPQMPNLVNALEDARVEAHLFVAKPGTQKHLEALRGTIFDAPRDEIVALIGVPWCERDADSQAIIGAYLLGCGYTVEGRLSDDVVAILRDPEVEGAILRSSSAPNVADLYAASFDVLRGFQRHGLLRNGDERDEPMGETDHPDESEGMGGEAGMDSSGCPHPKDAIVECASPKCKGNCTLCGTHIVSAPGEPGEGEGSDGERDEDADRESDGAPMDSDPSGERPSDPNTPESDAPPTPGKAKPTDDAEGDESEADDAADDATGGGEGDDTPDGFDPARGGADEAKGIMPDVPEARMPDSDPKVTEQALESAGGHDHESMAKGLDDHAVEAAVSMDEHGYEGGEVLTAGVSSIGYASATEVDRGGAGCMGGTSGAPNLAEVEKAIATVLPELRQTLAVNGRTGFTPGMRAGRIDARSLYRTATGYTRVFGRYTTPETRDYVFVLAADCSGSMGGGASRPMALQKALMRAEAEMLSRMGIPFIAYAFSGDGGVDGWSDGTGYGWRLVVSDVKGEHDSWDDAARKRLNRMTAHSANLDGSTMQYSRIRGRRFARNTHTKVVVLHHSDGGFPAENATYEKRRIQNEVQHAASRNTYFVGVGLGSSDAGRAGLDLVLCNTVADTRKVVAKIANLLGVK